MSRGPAGGQLAGGGPDPGDAVVEVTGLSKWFGGIVALSKISFTVGPGMTAVLGPNGAGKSTLLRALCGLTAPSEGRVRVLGREPRRHPDVLGRIGLVPQQEALFDALTALGFVRLAAELHGLPGPDGAARRALAQVELDPADRRPVRSFSKGMRQRVKVAQALVHDPEVLVLDEPLEGLDPRQRLRLVSLFRELAGQGRTVLVSSHILEEVERFGSRVIVIAQGRLAAEGDFHAIRELMDDRPHRLRVGTDRPRELAAGLVAAGAVVGVRVQDDGSIVVETADAPAFRRSVAPVARRAGARLTEVVPLDDDLDSVFRYLVDAPGPEARRRGRTATERPA